MSEDSKIHHESMIGTHFEGRVSRTSVSWLKVTCGACRLEMPMQDVPGRVEYRTPEHVIAKGIELDEETPSLADIKARHAAARLAEVQEAEESALRMVQLWTKTWQEASSLRVRLENASGVPEGGYEGAVPQRPSEGDYAGLPELDVSLLSAPVNAVDIRTDAEYAQGMTNEVNEQAKQALINAQGHQGAKVKVRVPGDLTDLRKAGMVGPEGGLTRKGSIARQRLVQAAEDAAFG